MVGSVRRRDDNSRGKVRKVRADSSAWNLPSVLGEAGPASLPARGLDVIGYAGGTRRDDNSLGKVQNVTR
jgi:hypothetical protein